MYKLNVKLNQQYYIIIAVERNQHFFSLQLLFPFHKHSFSNYRLKKNNYYNMLSSPFLSNNNPCGTSRNETTTSFDDFMVYCMVTLKGHGLQQSVALC